MITPVMTASAQAKWHRGPTKFREFYYPCHNAKGEKTATARHEAYPVKPQQEKSHKRQRAKPRGGPLVPFMDLSGDEPKPYPKSSPRSSQKIYAAKAYAYWKRTLKCSEQKIKSMFLKTYKDYAGIEDIVK